MPLNREIDFDFISDFDSLVRGVRAGEAARREGRVPPVAGPPDGKLWNYASAVASALGPCAQIGLNRLDSIVDASHHGSHVWVFLILGI